MTTIAIEGEQFLLDGRPTYPWNPDAAGLLMNIRAANGIFDDENPETRHYWTQERFGPWDPEANTDRLIAALPLWKAHGVLAFTVNFQGGGPKGDYGFPGRQPWHNSAFAPDGSLKPAYLARMERLIRAADSLGMAVIVGYFYFGQEYRLESQEAVIAGVRNATRWLVEKDFRNVLVEINNECEFHYAYEVMMPHRVHEMIALAQEEGRRADGTRLMVSTSFGGGSIPLDAVLRQSDFVLVHGNGMLPHELSRMVGEMRKRFRHLRMAPKPIVFNEDSEASDNLEAAFRARASWGYYSQLYKQDVPANWGICKASREDRFFNTLRALTRMDQA